MLNRTEKKKTTTRKQRTRHDSTKRPVVKITKSNEPRHEKICPGFSSRLRLKPACAATEAIKRLEISDIETRDIILSKLRTTKALIILRGCAGLSACLLFAYGKNRFSHDVAQIN